MQIKQLFDDEQAVSPVIGVILMVAITVILAAVIGTFVLGLGDQVQSSAPNANFVFEYDDGGDGFGNSNDIVTITHNGGQDVENENVVVQIEGTEQSSFAGSVTDFPTTISTGSQFEYDEAGSGTEVASGQTVRVVWSSDSGSSSNTLGQSEVPS